MSDINQQILPAGFSIFDPDKPMRIVGTDVMGSLVDWVTGRHQAGYDLV